MIGLEGVFEATDQSEQQSKPERFGNVTGVKKQSVHQQEEAKEKRVVERVLRCIPHSEDTRRRKWLTRTVSPASFTSEVSAG